MRVKQHDPRSRVTVGDPWYTDDQFATQLRTAGRRRIIEDRWHRFERMISAWLLSRTPFGPVVRLRVLDAGCGDGVNLVGLSRIAQANGWKLDLVGMDYNPLRTRRADRRGHGAAIVESSLYRMPWRDDAFDVVLCNHVLEHVPQLEAVLAELRRVLRRHGLLIAGVPNEGCLMARVRNRLIQPAIAKTTDHVHFFTDATFTAALAGAGLYGFRVERETFFFPCSYMNMACAELPFGYAVMAMLRRCFPSQAGGLVVAATKNA